jgi:hypothetical protein
MASKEEGQALSKEEQVKQLNILHQEMKKVGTPVEKKLIEIEYYKLFYKVYPKFVTEQAYTQQMNILNEGLKKLLKEQEQQSSSLFKGWEQATDTTVRPPPRSLQEIEEQEKATDAIYPLGGKKKSKKSKRTKSKRTKSKRTKSKRTKSKRTKK